MSWHHGSREASLEEKVAKILFFLFLAQIFFFTCKRRKEIKFIHITHTHVQLTGWKYKKKQQRSAKRYQEKNEEFFLQNKKEWYSFLSCHEWDLGKKSNGMQCNIILISRRPPPSFSSSPPHQNKNFLLVQRDKQFE